MPVLAALALPRHVAEQRDAGSMRLAARALRAAARRRDAPPRRWSLGVAPGRAGRAAASLALRPGRASSCRGSTRATLVVSAVRLPGIGLDESMRLRHADREGCSLRVPDEVRTSVSRPARPRSPPTRWASSMTDIFIIAEAARASGRRRTTAGGADRRDGRGARPRRPGHAARRSAADRDADQRDDRRRAQPTSAVKLYGDDLDVLRRRPARSRQARQRASRARPTSGPSRSPACPCCASRSTATSSPATASTPRDVLDVVESLGGTTVGEVVEGQRRFPLVVRLPRVARNDPEAIRRRSWSPTPPGRADRRCATLADVALDRRARRQISRENGQRRIVVAGQRPRPRHRQLRRRGAAAVAAEVKLPPGYCDRVGRPVRAPAARRRRG